MATIELEADVSLELPTITFLNSLGDVTVIWDKADDEAVKKLITKKIKDGVAFFIIEKKAFLRRRKRANSIDQIKERRADVKDKDLNELMKCGKGLELVEIDMSTFEFIRSSKDPEEISKRQSVAMPAVVGG